MVKKMVNNEIGFEDSCWKLDLLNHGQLLGFSFFSTAIVRFSLFQSPTGNPVTGRTNPIVSRLPKQWGGASGNAWFEGTKTWGV